ncbi:MAG: SUMF1/EgtB/PvdO family nonheme iron enzyme, partial [Planctomycetes bacterium]|nr:SUMF1/EgtB/PvdO family nonheme iron enzyme [Planctomycetota bacterium]
TPSEPTPPVATNPTPSEPTPPVATNPTPREPTPPVATNPTPSEPTPPVAANPTPRVDDLPSADPLPPADLAPADPAPHTAPAAGVVERPIDPYAPRDTSQTGRTTDPRGGFDTGRATAPQTPTAAPGPSQAMAVESRGLRFTFVRVPDQHVQVAGQPVRVTDLWLASAEVTVAQYREFVRANPRLANVGAPLQPFVPRTATGRSSRPGQDTWSAISDDDLARPITGVDLRLARALAEWLELRLPSSAEWLAGARSAGGRTGAPGSVVELKGLLSDPPEWTEEEMQGHVDAAGAPAVRSARDGGAGIRLARRR